MMKISKQFILIFNGIPQTEIFHKNLRFMSNLFPLMLEFTKSRNWVDIIGMMQQWYIGNELIIL